MATKYEVVHPDGTKSTRTTQKATYPYAVVREVRPVAVIIETEERLAGVATAHADAIQAAIDAKDYTITSRGFRADSMSFHSHTARLGDGGATQTDAHCSAEGLSQGIYDYATRDYDHEATQPVWDALVASGNDRQATFREVAAQHMARAAGLRDGTQTSDDTYEVLRWTSRPDLAEKALGEFEYYRTLGHTLAIVETAEVIKE